MEVPAPQAGKVEEILVKVGDKVSEGTPILRLRAEDGAAATRRSRRRPRSIAQQEPRAAAAAGRAADAAAAGCRRPAPAQAPPVRLLRRPCQPLACAASRASSASISTKLKGTGEKGRITADDVKAFLRGPARGARAPRPRRPAAWASPRSRRWTSRSSARSRRSRWRASRGCPARICTAPGSTSRTSPITTRPTSPRSRPTARSSTPRPRRRATASRCWPS